MLTELSNCLEGNFCILDSAGDIAFGEDTSDANPVNLVEHDINYNDTLVGVVRGNDKGKVVAAIIANLMGQEDDKKTILNETLERYKEITLLHDLAERLTRSLNPGKIGETVVQEIKNTLTCNNALVMLLNEESNTLKVLSSANPENANVIVKLGKRRGIGGSILKTGNAEIINDVENDERNKNNVYEEKSMMCAPLKVQDKIFGLVQVSTNEPHIYSSGDLKLFTTISAQASYALENALLHKSKSEEDRIKQNLQRYVSAQLVSAIIDSEDEHLLDPKKQNITVLFSDIRNFTRSCERLEPEIMVNYLNQYFTAMAEKIFEHQGTINKFVGDMVVALFGAPAQLPHNERQAVEAAITMQECLRVFPDEWIKSNFHTGIGINNGDMIVGNVGSNQHQDYTAIGDPVNVASRLQSMARGGQILVTESIYQKTRKNFEYRKFDQVVSLKGRDEPVQVFEVIYNN